MRFDRKSVKFYGRFSLYIALFIFIINILLVIIAGYHNIYIYVISTLNPILLIINKYFFRNFIDGIFSKSNHKIINKNERLIGKKAIITGILSLVIFLLNFTIFVFFEIWIIYWLFYI